MASDSDVQRNKPMALCRILPAVAVKKRWRQLTRKKGNLSTTTPKKLPSKYSPSENLPSIAKMHQAKKTRAPKRMKSRKFQPVLNTEHSKLLSIRQKALVYSLNALGAGIVACFVYPESCASRAFTAVSFYVLLILWML